MTPTKMVKYDNFTFLSTALSDTKKTSYHSHHFLNFVPRPMPSPFVHKIYDKTFNSERRIKISFIFTLLTTTTTECPY